MPHGWQFYASLGLITNHRENAMLPSLRRRSRARLRSQSGAHAGDHLTAIKSCEYTLATPERFDFMLRRRACLPVAANVPRASASNAAVRFSTASATTKRLARGRAACAAAGPRSNERIARSGPRHPSTPANIHSSTSWSGPCRRMTCASQTCISAGCRSGAACLWWAT